jgi:hypothetical protein
MIAPNAVSQRLFFAKSGTLSKVWHICDAALGKGLPDSTVTFMALHGDYVYPTEQCDTVLQLQIRCMADVICEKCLRQFELAQATITERGMLRFE